MVHSLKKDEFQKINKRFFTVLSFFTVGFIVTDFSSRLSRNIYESNKTNLEIVLRRNLNKKFQLGDFSGLRFLGFSVLNTKIEDIEVEESMIESKNMYVRLMPMRSILNREWVFSLNPNKLKINIKDDFFYGKRNLSNFNKKVKRKFNYEVHLNLKNKSKLYFNNLGVKGNIQGNLIYRSSNKQLITLLNANLKEKGNLKIRINKKFSNQFLSLYLKTNYLDLKDIKYSLFNEEFNFSQGNIKSNFKYFKSPKNNYCKGNISISTLNLFTIKLNENINSQLFKFNCIENKLTIKGNKLNYGTLISNLELDIPLNNIENNISFKGDIGFKKNPIPVITYDGNLPYSYNNNRINFGLPTKPIALPITFVSIVTKILPIYLVAISNWGEIASLISTNKVICFCNHVNLSISFSLFSFLKYLIKLLSTISIYSLLLSYKYTGI